jgi:Cu/Ag efflux pump CusA
MSQSARAVTFAVAIIMLVYLPLMALEGVEGRMFKPMAVTVALALLGAVIFTLLIFPALAAMVIKAPAHSQGTRTPRRNLGQAAEMPTEPSSIDYWRQPMTVYGLVLCS